MSAHANIRDALALAPFSGTLANGTPFVVRRPSALDLIEAIEFSAAHPTRMHAWFVWRHLLEQGNQAFSSIDEVLGCDALVVAELAQHISNLYGEGRD